MKNCFFFHNFWTLDKTEGVVLPGDSGSAITAEVDKAVVGILVCGAICLFLCTGVIIM